MPGLKQKIYQLVIGRLDGQDIHSSTYRQRLLEEVHKGIGGFIVFGGKRTAVKELIEECQSAAAIPLFVASDIERGVGQQIEGATVFPSQMAAAAGAPKDHPQGLRCIEQSLRAIADEAIDIGINMPLIPVLDVNQNPDNPIICTRAFSDNAETVAWYGKKYIHILESTGLISCAKHFPGHGDTAIDSHIALPVIAKSLKDLMKTDILPFRDAIQAGVSSIMLGHLSIPALDAVPTSLSSNVVTGLLRNELEYEGIVMTDALTMHALNEYDDVPVRCMQAGVDVILHPADADSVVQDIHKAVTGGELAEQQVDRAFQRVISCKEKLKTKKKAIPDYNAHSNIAEELFHASITLVKAGATEFNENLMNADLLFTGDENRIDTAGIQEHVSRIHHIKNYDVGTSQPEVIIAVFTTVAAWQGSSGIGDEDRKRIEAVIARAGRSIVISFGSPYVLRYFPAADALVAVYDSSVQAQRAAMKCLKGEMQFEGRLPVSLDLS